MGFLRELAITFDAIEDRDINLKTVASKRKKAASRLQWDIVRVEGADETEAERHEAGLRYFYENLKATSVMESNQRGGVALLVRQMMDAIGKRYACHEIVWKPTPAALANEAVPNPKLKIAEIAKAPRRRRRGAPNYQDRLGGSLAKSSGLPGLLTAEFRFCPLWFFENRTGRLRFIPTPFGVDGVDMPDGEWLVTVGDGIMEACAVAYMFKTMSLKDWVSFSEKFGLPGVVGKTDAQKDSVEWAALQDACAALMNDWVAVMNKGDTIELLETKGGAANLPFPSLVEYMDRKMAAIWRGADLSTISSGKEGTGASLQGDEGDLLLEDDAQLITETLNQQVDTYVIEYLFGATEPLAYFKLGTGREEADDAEFRRKAWLGFQSESSTAATIANLTNLDELNRSVGLPTNEDVEQPIFADSPTPAPTPGRLPGDRALENETDPAEIAAQLEKNSLPIFARALAHDLRPVVTRLARILEIQDPEIQRVRLAAFMQELPRLKDDIGADPSTAQVLNKTIGAALINGFSRKGPEAALKV